LNWVCIASELSGGVSYAETVQSACKHGQQALNGDDNDDDDELPSLVWFDIFYVCVSTMTQIFIYCWSQTQVHTDERTQVHSTQFSLVVTLPISKCGRHAITSLNVPLSLFLLVLVDRYIILTV